MNIKNISAIDNNLRLQLLTDTCKDDEGADIHKNRRDNDDDNPATQIRPTKIRLRIRLRAPSKSNTNRSRKFSKCIGARIRALELQAFCAKSKRRTWELLGGGEYCVRLVPRLIPRLVPRLAPRLVPRLVPSGSQIGSLTGCKIGHYFQLRFCLISKK